MCPTGLLPAAHVPLFLYPFLNTVSKTRPFEYLRLTSLGVIGALVKVDDTDVINFLLSTEIIPLCLRTMEMGSELSKTVATFIVQKILLDDVSSWAEQKLCALCLFWKLRCMYTGDTMGEAGSRTGPWRVVHVRASSSRSRHSIVRSLLTVLQSGAYGYARCRIRLPCDSSALHCRGGLQVGLNYICATAERFFAVGAVLGNMVVMLAEQPSPRLLKHIIRCYLRLSDNPRYVPCLRMLHALCVGTGCQSANCPRLLFVHVCVLWGRTAAGATDTRLV